MPAHSPWIPLETSRPIGTRTQHSARQPSNKEQALPQDAQGRSFRFWFFLLLTVLTYGFFVWSLFRERLLLPSAGAFCVLFIELIFLAIDLRTIKKRTIWLLLIGIGLLIRLFMPNPVWQLAIALWISLFTIWFLLPFLRSYFSTVRKITRLSYFTSGGYLFTLMTAILFGFAILGMNSKFPFQCKQISSRSDKIIQTSTNPFQLGILGHQQEEKNLIPLGTGIVPPEEDSALKEIRLSLKTNLREGLVDTQKSINTKICEAIVSQLESVYQNPVFQIGVIFGMYLLFYGVIRLLVWVITLIGYVLFWITKRFGLYRTEKRLEEVEEVV